MQISTTKKRKSRRVLIFTIIILFLAAGGATFWWLSTNDFAPFNKNPAENNSQNSNKNSDSNNSTDSENSDNDKNANDPANSGEGGKTPTQTDTPTVSGEELDISAHAYYSGENLLVGTIQIYPILSSGTCTLTVGDFTTSTEIIAEHNGPNYSICENFSVPKNQISGESFTLKVVSGNKSGEFTGAINE